MTAAARLADDKKAEDVEIVHVDSQLRVADYFVIATGQNRNHVRAIYDELHPRGFLYLLAEGSYGVRVPNLEAFRRTTAPSDPDYDLQEDVAQLVRTNRQQLASNRRNVQGWVQRVLRESYLIQSEVLWDFSHRVKFFNDQRKRIRDKLNQLRQTRTSWAGQEDGSMTPGEAGRRWDR